MKNLTNFKDVNFKDKIITVEQFYKKVLEYVSIDLKFEEASIILVNTANKLLKKAKLKTYVQGFAKLRRPTFRSVSH